MEAISLLMATIATVFLIFLYTIKRGFFNRLRMGWRIFKMTLSVIAKDKELLIFPLLGAMSAAIIFLIFMLGVIVPTGGFSPAYIITGPLTIAACYIVATYFNVAVMGCAMMRFEGKDPTFRDGIKFASSKLGRVVEWSIVITLIGIVAGALSELAKKIPYVGEALRAMVGLAFSLITFLALPVLVFENVSILDALKKSASLFKKTWGEILAGTLAFEVVDWIFIFMIMAAFFGMFGAAVTLGPYGLMLGIFGFAAVFIAWICLRFAARNVFCVALYRYALTGEVSKGFSEEVLANPWIIK